jgi:hypothetical protein
MCLADGVLFGEFPSSLANSMIEWFEINCLFGITEFNFYNATAFFAPEIWKVLNYYIDKGILNLYQQNPPIEYTDRHQRNVAEIAMRTSLNDCLYRNMYRYKYIVIIDLDEIIVPRNFSVKNYSQIISKQLDKLQLNHPYDELNSVSFNTLVFYKIYQQFYNDTDPIQLDISRYRYFNDQPIVKSFLNPRLCLAAFSHFCLVPLNGTETSEIFTLADATVFHYRNKCVSAENPKVYNKQSCSVREQTKKQLDWMLNFKDTVMNRVKLVKEAL